MAYHHGYDGRRGSGDGSAAALRWRWAITGAFGLIHGFGFSFVLQEDLQYAGSHFLLSLFAFNVGVEIGQLAFLLIVLPLLALLLRSAPAQRAGVVLISALVAHTAWHWMIERMEALRFVRWPDLDPAWASLVVLVAVLTAACGGVVWLGRAWGRRRHRQLWARATTQDAQRPEATPVP